jgi:hypothetical protein
LSEKCKNINRGCVRKLNRIFELTKEEGAEGWQNEKEYLMAYTFNILLICNA